MKASVVVVGVEKLSDWTDFTDRSTAFIFADGAGAVVIGPSELPAIGPVVWGADGGQLDAITMTQSLIEYRHDPGPKFPALVMQGQQVFRWAVGDMAKTAQQALDAAGVAAEDLDAFIPHQANMRITDAMIRALKLPAHVPVARDIAYTGNTSAASIPLAMERMLDDHEVEHGGTALLIGFGACSGNDLGSLVVGTGLGFLDDGLGATLGVGAQTRDLVAGRRHLGHDLAVGGGEVGLMLALDPQALWGVTLSLLAGTPALALLGAIGAALTVTLRRGGLLGMQERLEMVGGSLALANATGGGLLLRAVLPLHKEEQKEEEQ